MATRRLAVFGIVAAALFSAAPLSAQLQPSYDWTAERPDGIAPIGVGADRTYRAGAVNLSYRFAAQAFDGQRIGSSEIALGQALDMFFMVPTHENVTMSLLGLGVGLTDHVTLEGQVPILVRKTMDQVTGDGQAFTNKTGSAGSSGGAGVGDVNGWAHVLVYDHGSYRAHVTMGVSVPVGSVEETVTTPLSTPDQTRAPYPLQIGSGSLDLLPGVTFMAMNQEASTGIQVNAAIRTQDNDQGYRLGNRYQGSIWGAYRASDAVSVSVRLTATKTGDVSGSDPLLNPDLDPASAPGLQGGTEVEMPFGLNVYFPDGVLKGNRLGIEAAVPIYQKLHGPQLSHDWTLTAGWEYTFQLFGGS